MGVSEADFPVFAHLPYVLGMGGEALSKRYGSASISWYREQGFLPEALCNYLALLGWSRSDNRELFTLGELAAEFDLARVGKNAARFDMKKLESMNGDKIRELEPADFVHRIIPFLQKDQLVSDPPTAQQLAVVQAAAPLIQGRIATLTEASAMLGFMLVDEASFTADPDDAARSLGPGAAPVLQAAQEALSGVAHWSPDEIRAALQAALIDGMGLGPKAAFAGAVRVAVTGRRIGPPLFESMELLGKDRTLSRLAAAAAAAA
jgi:glutamyl-tRNA synthetase